MPPDNLGDDEPRIYHVRLSEPAEAELENAYLNLLRTTTLSFADRWQDGLVEALNGLSLFPMRYEAAQESAQFQMAVRRMVYRLGRVSYRVLFHLMDEDGDGHDDTVNVLHVRHGAQQPLGEADEDSE